MRKVNLKKREERKGRQMDKKHILFMIGINEMAEHKEVLIDAVQKRIALFKENKDKLNADICLYPSDRNEWKKLNLELSEELFRLMDAAAEEDNISLIDITVDAGEQNAEKYDAYYGSPSFMPLQFSGKNKPVMIADLEV